MSGHPRPRKRFGQHFLTDVAVIDRILRAVDARQSDHVIEIGPGRGALTDALARSAGKLTLVELDRDLVQALQQRYRDDEHVTVVGEDALRVEFGRFGDALRIVGNLPYNISTPLLFHLAGARSHIRDMTFMLQKEVVERITAAPGGKAWGRLGVMLALTFDSECLFEVGPDSFDPPPRVDSAVVRLVPRVDAPRIADEAVLAALVRQAFSQRRKTLRNALRGLADAHDLGRAGIDPGARAETVDAERYAALANVIAER